MLLEKNNQQQGGLTQSKFLISLISQQFANVKKFLSLDFCKNESIKRS